jgi:hypothetical protein
LENISLSHGVSLLRWRSGGLEHPHDTPPYPFTPSPTFAYSSRLRWESHSRTPYPSAKPTIRTIAVSSIVSPPIRELEVTIKSHQTYMNLTDVFFKQTFVVDL